MARGLGRLRWGRLDNSIAREFGHVERPVIVDKTVGIDAFEAALSIYLDKVGHAAIVGDKVAAKPIEDTGDAVRSRALNGVVHERL